MTLWDFIESKMQEAVEEYKSHLWKDAQGNDLPDEHREVIVLVQNRITGNDSAMVSFAHRPNVGEEAMVSFDNGKTIEKVQIKRFGKGGWNIPNVVWWADIELPCKQFCAEIEWPICDKEDLK